VRVAGRRSSKLVSLVTSCFTGNYVRWWASHFHGQPLQATPMFDGRAVCYPSDASLRDYLAWRQADAHINNQASIVRLIEKHVKQVPIWESTKKRTVVTHCSTTLASGRWSNTAIHGQRRRRSSRQGIDGAW
jgi:tRNA(His) 5'-end guanylyltransferase